jgi:hypothetical protein
LRTISAALLLLYYCMRALWSGVSSISARMLYFCFTTALLLLYCYMRALWSGVSSISAYGYRARALANRTAYYRRF